MDIRIYQREAEKFLKKRESQHADLDHAALGLTSEYTELFEAIVNYDNDNSIKNKANIGEEIGDMVWFFSTYCSIRGFDLYAFKPSFLIDAKKSEMPDSGVLLFDLANNISKLANVTKGITVYKRDPSFYVDENDILNTISSILGVLCIIYDLRFEAVIGTNIDKLTKRHNGRQFTDETNNNRDIPGEQGILESGV